jgi:trans-aconitate methyltransferase
MFSYLPQTSDSALQFEVMENTANSERKQQVQQIYATVIAALGRYPLPAGMIVDVGCGNGAITLTVARAFPRRYVMGIDFSPEQLTYAHTHNSGINVLYSHGDAEELPYIHCAALYSAATLQYVADVSGFLRTAFDRLNPGGVLWCSVQLVPDAEPQRDAIREAWTQFMHHSISFHTADELCAMLAQAGYIDIEVQIRPQPTSALTPKRLEILTKALHARGLTIADADANGWLAMGEFIARKPDAPIEKQP